jgi:hypothetical protein
MRVQMEISSYSPAVIGYAPPSPVAAQMAARSLYG